MIGDIKRKVAFISSFLPRKCGIATFCSDLINNVRATAGSNFEPLVVAVEGNNRYQYGDLVKFEIRRNVKNDYVSAADYLNFSHVDAINLQHEFGLFGGEAGDYIELLLNRVNAPIITTLHTVLDEPLPEYHKALVDICNLSEQIIIMNKHGLSMLKEIYNVDTNKVRLIPHGIPDLPFVDSNYYKHKFTMEGRRTILTFGLLGRGKGIENMLQALPEVVKHDPSVLYIVLGMTHPEVLRHEGESYRFELQRMAKDLGVQENVIFHNHFVDNSELHDFLCASDIYVTPYLNREQLTSGTLAFAVGTGKAVVSTPYWAAEELLADGRGKLVNFNDPRGLAETIVDLLKNDTNFYTLRRRAYEYGRNMTWPTVGLRYWDIFSAQRIPAAVRKPVESIEQAISILEVPEPPLLHLKKMTDDTGLYQHAKFTIPNRDHGYCTDDNARAVVAMAKYYCQYAEPEALRLFDIYLSFICHAQNPDGTVRNFLGFERNWINPEPEHDGLGRALWAFGSVIAEPPSPAYLSIIKECFDNSVKHVPNLSPRGMAYAIFGMSNYLRQFPGASDIKRYMHMAADRLLGLYQQYSEPDWQWFEHILAYDNAVLPHALFISGKTFEDNRHLDVAIKAAEFLLENTYDGEKFSFIGCNGWYSKGQKRASFDQQPLEACGTTLMLKDAYRITGKQRYLILQRKAFDWFLGENDLGIAVYDFKTKGCCDGLQAGGVNLNQGAESLLSFMLSLLCIVESYTAQRREDEKTNLDKEQKTNVNTRIQSYKKRLDKRQIAKI